MSYRAAKSGLALEAQETMKAKFDPALAGKTLRWLRTMKPRTEVPNEVREGGEAVPGDKQEVQWKEFYDALKDGFALGYLMASLNPAYYMSTPKKTWTRSNMPAFETARQRERIGLFLSFVKDFGVPDTSSFQNDQLYEETDLTQVAICLSQLGTVAQSKPDYPGPQGFWTALHHENKRDFTEEQKRAGHGVIGLQAGYTGGANASGVHMGGRRHINDMH